MFLLNFIKDQGKSSQDHERAIIIVGNGLELRLYTVLERIYGFSVREFLTGLAILVIGVLFAALIAPFVVDFNSQRAFFEEKLTEAVGMPVSIGGQIDIRILPFPVLHLEKLAVQTPDHSLSATAQRVSLDIATMPLLKGEVHVMDALVEGPSLNLAMGAFSGLKSGTMPAGSDGQSGVAVSIEKLTIKDGSLAVQPAAGVPQMIMSKLDLDISAASLKGPWRVDGAGVWNERPVALRVSTGTADETGSFRIKAGLDHPGGGYKADIDGMVGLDPHLGFAGKLVVAGEMAWPEADHLGTRPWSVSTQAHLDGSTLELTAAEINAGGDEGGFKLNGSGAGVLGDGRSLSLLFDARQIDLDRPLHVEGKPNPALPVVLSAWRNALLASDDDLRPSIPVDLSIAIDSVLAGGDTMRSLKLDTRLDSGGVTLKRGDVLLPGNSKLSASGDIGLVDGGAFYGHASFSSKEFARFGGWVDGEASGRSARYGEAHEVGGEADLALSSTLIGASNLKIMLDQSSITGLVRYALPEMGQRGRLDAQLASDGFDLEQLPEASLVAARFGTIDASVVIDARNVRAPRVRDAHAGRLQMKATASDEGLVIDMLDIADIGGANVKASGRLTSAGDRVEALIDARDVGPIAVLFRKVFPGSFANAIADRAKLLGPAKFNVTAQRASDKARTIQLAFDGTAAGSALSGTGNMTVDDADLALVGDVKASSSDAGQLLRQIGISVLPLPLDGGAKLSASIGGHTSAGFTIGIKGNVAGSTLSADLKLDTNSARVTGPIRFAANDALPLLQALAWPVPDVSARVPLTLSAKTDWDQAGVRLNDLDLQASGRRISGAVNYIAASGKLAGDVAVDAVSLPAIASLVIGPIAAPTAGGLWPSTRFTPPGPPPFDVEVALKAKTFDTGFGPMMSGATMKLVWQPDSIEIRDFAGDALKGHLRGTVSVRNASGLASYLGKLNWTDVSLQELLPKTGISGSADFEFDLGGSGESVAAFANILSGGGAMKAKNVTLPGFDVSALGTVTKTLDAERDPTDPKKLNDLIAAGLMAKPLTISSLQAPITASGGVIRFGPMEAHQGGALVQGSLALDIRSLRVDGRSTLLADDAPKDWAGPPPQASVGLKGLLGGSMIRDIDASTLANIITTRTVTRELARLEAQEADLRERNAFARRLKHDREMAEQAKKAAEEERLAEEARKAEALRAAEEARKKAEAEEAAKKAKEAADTQKILDELAAQSAAEDAARKAKEKEVLDGVNQLIKGGAPSQP